MMNGFQFDLYLEFSLAHKKIQIPPCRILETDHLKKEKEKQDGQSISKKDSIKGFLLEKIKIIHPPLTQSYLPEVIISNHFYFLFY